MLQKAAVLTLAVLCPLLVGCGTVTVIRGPTFDPSVRKSYMILPFGDTNASLYKMQNPDAAATVRDAVETGLMERGILIIPYDGPEHTTGITASQSNNYRTTSVELTVGKAEYFEHERGMELARNAKADIAVFGIVKTYVQGVGTTLFDIIGRTSRNPNETRVAFSIKAVNVATNEIMWKVDIDKEAQFDYDCEPAEYAKGIAADVIEELFAQG